MTNENTMTPDAQVLEHSLILPVRQPVSILFRNVKIDAFLFFKTLAKGTASYASGRFWNLPADVIEGLQAIKIAPLDSSERAWLLIYKAMLKGAAELVQPSIALLDPDESTKDALITNLDATLMERQVTIDASFFQRPQDLDILKDFQELILQWLTGWGLEEERAQTVVQRLPAFFVSALHEEWRANFSDYTAVIAAFNTPFIAATEYLLAWERYYAMLRKQVQEAMFEETFSLEQVYVPLRAYYETEAPLMEAEGQEKSHKSELKKIRVVAPLQNTLDVWLEKRDQTEALRVVSGGPGSGKSSFAKMWAAALTNQTTDLRVLYIPLHNFNLKDSLENAVGDFVRQTYLFDRNPLDALEGEKRLLLILDGLDEIAQRGRASTELARDFVAEVSKTLDQRNQSECRVQALITGRELVVQSNSTHFRQIGQILHALPYKTEVSNDEGVAVKIKNPRREQRGISRRV